MKPQLSLFKDNVSIEKIEQTVGADWTPYLQADFNSKYFDTLFSKIKEDRLVNTVVPDKADIFKMYRMLPPKSVKCVILSQSPYPSRQSDGIAFSAKHGRPLSLQRLQKSFETKEIDLSYLVNQGVWLQNMILTANTINSLAHKHWGWERFVLKSLQTISDNVKNLVWLAIGSDAYKAIKKVAKSTDLVLKVNHPVAKSVTDSWTCKPELMKLNSYLIKYNKKPINWSNGEEL